MPLTRIIPPWSPDQVSALNRFQAYPFVHPFTCSVHDELVATEHGWNCPHPGCDYRQYWAWAQMLEEHKDPVEEETPDNGDDTRGL